MCAHTNVDLHQEYYIKMKDFSKTVCAHRKKFVTLHCQKEKTKILPCDIKKSKIGYCLG
jgi:hypothetical protein